MGGGIGLHRGDEVGDRGGLVEVQRQLAQADAGQVGVSIDEARIGGRALQVEVARALGRLGLGGGQRADEQDPVVADQHGLGGRGGVDAGVDRAAVDQQVIGLSGGQRGRGEERGEQGTAQRRPPELSKFRKTYGAPLPSRNRPAIFSA
jgi:hypothetical protein